MFIFLMVAAQFASPLPLSMTAWISWVVVEKEGTCAGGDIDYSVVGQFRFYSDLHFKYSCYLIYSQR